MNGSNSSQVAGLKELAKQNPLFFAGLAVIIVLIAFFWNALFLILRGLFYAAIVLALIFVVILVLAKIRYSKPSVKILFAEKKKILRTIRIAEKKYMKRKLSEKDFNSLFREKQKELIEVEALLDQQYNKESSEKVNKQLLDVQVKKRHVLKDLLDEKMRLIKEMDLMEKRYLKRKIDAKTYQLLVQRNQKELIELEASIKGIYEEANISKVMDNLKQKLSSLDKQNKVRKKTMEEKEEEEQLKVAKDIAEQVSGK